MSRVVHMVGGKADFTFMSHFDLICEGTIGINYKTADKLVNTVSNHSYRIIVRTSNQDWVPRRRELLSANDTVTYVYRNCQRYFAHSSYCSTTITIAQYTDDSFTTLMDIPLDDPLIAMMSYYYSDNMRSTIMRGLRI